MYYDTSYIVSLIVVYSIYAILLLLGGLNLYNIKKIQSMIDDLADEVYEIKRGLEDDRKAQIGRASCRERV